MKVASLAHLNHFSLCEYVEDLLTGALEPLLAADVLKIGRSGRGGGGRSRGRFADRHGLHGRLGPVGSVGRGLLLLGRSGFRLQNNS